MTGPFSFRLLATDGAARRGEIVTPQWPSRSPTAWPPPRRRRAELARLDERAALRPDFICAMTNAERNDAELNDEQLLRFVALDIRQAMES